MKWQIQEAEARFSELVKRTLREGSQTVTRHGRPVAEIRRSREATRVVKLECT